MPAEFTTQTGCRVRVRPAPALGPGTVILSLRVEHPHSVGYVGTEDDRTTIQYAEIAFTEQERGALVRALSEEADRG